MIFFWKWILINIKQLIVFLLVNPMRMCRFRIRFIQRIGDAHRKYDSAILILASPQHGNLGDHAIVYSELSFLKDLSLAERVIEVSNNDYMKNKSFLKERISVNDVIIIDGGGNLGILWAWEDDKISEIIESYNRNSIIVFPQTCFYDSSIESQIRLQKNKKIYARAKKLTITLRDIVSYKFCADNFVNVKLLCVPDIVLYNNFYNFGKKNNRNGVLLCFRKDLERVVTQEEVQNLKTFLEYKNISYQETSTITNYPVNSVQRENELRTKWGEFASARMVITDRLHGMIFAAITNTPCLAIDNISKKVSGVYDLISELDYVRVCENINEVSEYFDQYLNIGNCNYQDFVFSQKYDELKKTIQNICNL